MAEMDMAPVAAAQRVIGWASAAKPGDESARVIAMIGVNPVTNDSGVPASLALGASTTAAVAYASADVPAEAASAPVVETPAPVPEAAAAVAVAETPAPAPDHIIKPVEIAASSPVIQAPRSPARQAVRPVSPAQSPNMLRPVNLAQGTAWVVQLGAYDSPAIAQEKWRSMTARNSVLKLFPTITSQVNVNGRVYHRLAVAGFGNRQTAVSLCGKVQSRGNSCFVRMGGAEAAPSKWAVAAKPRQLAMR
jgi:cell division septation protein DedD